MLRTATLSYLIIAFSLNAMPPAFLHGMNFSIILSICCLIFAVKFKKSTPAAILSGALLALITVWGPVSRQHLVLNLPSKQDRQWQCDFRIVSKGVTASFGAAKYKARVDTCHIGNTSTEIGFYAFIYFSKQQALHQGHTYRAQLKVKPIRGFANASSFDYEKWAFSEALVWSASIKSEPKVQQASPPSYAVHYWNRLVSHLEHSELSEGQIGYAKALLLGDKSGLESNAKNTLSTSGLMHLFVISGLHLALIAGYGCGLGYLLCRVLVPIQRYVPRPDMMWLTGYLFASCYWLILPDSNPVFRAWITISLFVLIHFARLHVSLFDKLIVSIALVILIQPTAVFSVGFYLTIAALLSIWLINFWLNDYSLSKWQQITVFHLSISILMMPVLLLLGFKISIFSPLLNLILVPVFSLVFLPGLLLSFIAGVFDVPYAQGLLSMLLSMLELSVAHISRIQESAPILFGTSAVVFIVAVMICLVVLSSSIKRKTKLVMIVSLLSITAISSFYQQSAPISITFYDVGQGTAVSWQKENAINFYDLGPAWNQQSAFDSQIAPLIAHGSRLDVLVISHNDLDHAGGESDLYGLIQPARLIRGELSAKHNNTHQLCQAGQGFQSDFWQIEVIYPQQLGLSGNAASCVVKLTLSPDRNSLTILLTGDINNEQEKAILATVTALNADVLLLSHHGSKNSNHHAFLKAVSAEYWVASAGFWNRYNHPHPNVTNRGNRAKLLNTAKLGAIHFTQQANGQWKLSYAREKLRIWHYITKKPGIKKAAAAAL